MDKVELFVLGLSTTPTMNNSYTLILKEVDGERRLPIIIGGFEAQAIALEIEEVTPPRPMTHDLFKAIIDNLDLSLTEVNISELKEGTFYANLYFEDKDIEIDARPSDAIAIAIRLQVPIFINSDILDEVGVNVEENVKSEPTKPTSSSKKKEGQSALDKLNTKLNEAIKNEDYELAAQLRDEMQKIIGNS
jgi:bifunctional DNase/RNase